MPNYAAAAGLESQGGYPVNRQVPGTIKMMLCLGILHVILRVHTILSARTLPIQEKI